MDEDAEEVLWGESSYEVGVSNKSLLGERGVNAIKTIINIIK